MFFLGKRILAGLLFMFSTTEPAKQPEIHIPPINININQSQDQASKTTSQSQAHNENTNSVRNSISSTLKSFLQSINNARGNSVSFLSEHKYKIIAGAIITIYLVILRRIQNYLATINDPDAWCHWNNHLETSELTNLPYSKIQDQLIRDIQKKYLIDQTQLEFFDSFARFIQEIKYEINIIKAYIRLHKKIAHCKCTKLFFINHEHLQQAENNLKRTMFVYHAFADWHTNRNLH